MDRTVSGPDRDVLLKEEVCQYLRISDTTLDQLIKRGLFPKPVPFGEKGGRPVWMWEDVWAFRWLRMRLAAGAGGEEDTDGGK